jgi:hypothetical protein
VFVSIPANIQTLAHAVGIKCRLVRGKFYCGMEDDAAVVVQLPDRTQWMVDLVTSPGRLLAPGGAAPDGVSPEAAEDVPLSPTTPQVMHPPPCLAVSADVVSGLRQRAQEGTKGRCAGG